MKAFLFRLLRWCRLVKGPYAEQLKLPLDFRKRPRP